MKIENVMKVLKGIDIYNNLRSQMCNMTIEEMDNFNIEITGSIEEIKECMECAQSINDACDRYEKSQAIFVEKMDLEPVRHYNNLIIASCKESIEALI